MTTPVNRSPATPLGFKMSFLKIPEVTFFLQKTPLPGVGFPTVPEQATPFKDIPHPGDKLVYQDLVMTFMVDEDLVAWETIHNWLVGLGFPQDFKQYADLIKKDQQEFRAISPIQRLKAGAGPVRPPSDASLFILNSFNVPTIEVIFSDVFPYDLTGLDYESDTEGNIQYLKATARFKYTIYQFKRVRS